MGGVRVQEEPSCQDLPLAGARSLEPLRSPLHWPVLMLGYFPSLRKTLFSREDGPAVAGGPTHHLNTFHIWPFEKQANSKPSKYIADSSYRKALYIHHQVNENQVFWLLTLWGRQWKPLFMSEHTEIMEDNNFMHVGEESMRSVISHHPMSKFQRVWKGDMGGGLRKCWPFYFWKGQIGLFSPSTENHWKR